MKIEIKKLSKNAIIPTRGSDDAAGYDLYSTEDFTLNPGSRHLFKTNVSVKIPRGYYGRIAPRSGLAFKNGIDVLGGVIDSDYIGDVGVILFNSSVEDLWRTTLQITKGDRIAQLIIEKCYDIEFEEVEKLEDTSRGSGGYGSTGK